VRSISALSDTLAVWTLKMASEDLTPQHVTLQQQLQAERDAQNRLDELNSLKKTIRKVLKPYLDHQRESFERVDELISVAMAMPTLPSEVASPRSQQAVEQDMLRAAVVLIHAYLEDFLRTIARELLPEASVECLDKIPLAGLSGRPDKFSLGKLVRHKGKLVDDVLRESVSEHLDRSTFNNKGEIEHLLETLGFELAPIKGYLVDIQEMMQRRHQIVHRADRVNLIDSHAELQSISPFDVSKWLRASSQFTDSLSLPLLERLLPPEAKAYMFPEKT
jgi:hypothetical protein